MARYLDDLNTRLAQGVARLPSSFRARHAGFLARKQNADGGFSGREGESDLYYSGFALRGLSVLDALTPEVSRQAAGFLQASLSSRASVVDLFSLLYSCLLVQTSAGIDVLADSATEWPERVAATLETFRTPDGGYNKSPGATAASTYHPFLVGLCYEMLGRSWPDPEAIVRFVQARRREDGGFVEVAPMRRSGTNPTAAGVGILQLAQGANAPAEQVAPTVDFLARMAGDDGGLRANDRVPLSDLLSTFTGCWTLAQLGGLARIDTKQVAAFAQAVELDGGGFRGGLWDEATDVEYTFYGLGTLALCSHAAG